MFLLNKSMLLRVAATTPTGPWIPWQNCGVRHRNRAAKSVAKSCIEPPSGLRPSVGIRVYLTKLLRKVSIDLKLAVIGCQNYMWLVTECSDVFARES